MRLIIILIYVLLKVLQIIFYEINQLVEPNTWNGKVHSISIFSIIEFLKINSMNIITLLLYIVNFIKNRSVKYNLVNNVT